MIEEGQGDPAHSEGPPDVVVEFGADSTAPGLVRRALKPLFDGGDDPIAEDALLSASELVTNVVEHTKDGGQVRAWDPKPDVPMRMEVEDHDQSLPIRQNPAPYERTGRGMMVVDRASDAWGMFRTADGKVVWAEFDRNRRRTRR